MFQHAERLTERSNIAISMPKTAKHPQHRANAQAPTAEECLECSVLVPFLDHVISDLGNRFTKHVEKACRLEGILPENLSTDSTTSLIEAVKMYKGDLPKAEIGNKEFCCWKARWMPVPVPERPEKLEGCLEKLH